MMRIAYLNSNYYPAHTGGGYVHVGQFIKNALDLGHEIWVYPGNQFPGTRIVPTDRFNHIKTLRKMDALYIRLEDYTPKMLSWSLPPRRPLYGFPLVVWEFNTLPGELDTDKQTLDNYNSKFYQYSPGCDLGVCVSPALSAIISSKLKIKRLITVSNGSDPDLFRPDAPIAPRMITFQDKFNVVWIGTIRQTWHDMALIGEAAKLLWADNEGRGINLHIIGAGLSGFIAEMPPNVFYWGAEKYESLPNWLSGMQAGLSTYRPSRASLGSPLKIFDYMSSGLPFVSTEHPVADKILEELDAKDLVIPFQDSKTLANVLIGLVSDRERCERIGAASRRLVVEKYNWRKSVIDTLDIMSEILAEKRTPS